MRIWQIAGLTAILGIMAVTTGWKPLYVLAYGLAVALVLSSIWMALSLQGIAFSRTTPVARATVGERLEERLAIENRTWFPKLWVQVSDGSTLPGHHAGYVSSIGPHKRITWRARTLCRRRGRYVLGPVAATTGDPLGLFQHTLPLAPAYPLLVLPAILPLRTLALFQGVLPGRGRGSRRSLQTATNVVTVRDYVPGDPLTRIHWPTTARHGQFMVKEFDLDPTIDATILVDLDTAAQAGTGDDTTEEYAVTIAASIATYLLRQEELAVSISISGMPEGALQLDRGQRQLDRILELLAVARPIARVSLAEALATEEVRLARHSVLVIITPSADGDWPDAVYHLQRRGIHPLVIALDPSSFDPTHPGNAFALEALRGIGAQVIPLRFGDDIAGALERGPR